MIISGIIFTILNYICFCISRFLKAKKYIVALDIIARIFTIIGLYCFNSLTGSYNTVISLVMVIVLTIKEFHCPDKKMIWLYIIFQLLYIFILGLTFVGISSVLAFISFSIALFHTWFMPPQMMRIIGGLNSTIYLIYQISIQNWAGLLEIIAMLSCFISYFKYNQEKKQCQKYCQ